MPGDSIVYRAVYVAIDVSVGRPVHCSVHSPVHHVWGAQSYWSGGGPVGGEDGTLGFSGPLCVP